MIDEKTLAEYEARSLELGCTGNAEIIRLARRYLTDREREVVAVTAAIERGEWEYISEQDIRNQFDAAADRLLEGCSSQAHNTQAQNGGGE